MNSKTEIATSERPIPLIVAWIPVIVLIGLLMLNVRIYKDNATYGPNQIALLMSGAIAALIGGLFLVPVSRIVAGIVASLTSSISAMLILLLIGGLTATWMVSGIVPAMIFYGLKILSPSLFLVASMVICSIVSLATGSSWTTVGTVGVALLGIGQALGIPSPMIAGSIISGAYFGDKISPLSDTTNLAPAMAGTDLFTHVRYMIWTTVPSFLLAAGLFLLLGMVQKFDATASSGEALSQAMQSKFVLSPFLFIVPVIVIVMAAMRVDATVALFTAMMLGAFVAVVAQPQIIREIAANSGITAVDASYAEQAYVAMNNVIGNENKIAVDNPEVAKLFETRGMNGMLSTIWLVFCAMCFGGAMEGCGLLRRITEPLVNWATSTASLIATTAVSCIFVNITAADQYLSIVVPGRMFRKSFRERGLAPQNLSRTLEDAGTVTSVLIPWNTCGATQQAVLGVSTWAYLPYCFFNIISPFMTILFAAFNIAIARIDPEFDEEKTGEGSTNAS